MESSTNPCDPKRYVEKKHICSICGYRTISKWSLKRHLKSCMKKYEKYRISLTPVTPPAVDSTVAPSITPITPTVKPVAPPITPLTPTVKPVAPPITPITPTVKPVATVIDSVAPTPTVPAIAPIISPILPTTQVDKQNYVDRIILRMDINLATGSVVAHLSPIKQK